MKKKLVFYNSLGQVVRVLPWNTPKKIWTVLRKDTGRVEFLSSIDFFKRKKISFQIIKEVQGSCLSEGKMNLGDLGFLALKEPSSIEPQLENPLHGDYSWQRKAVLFCVFFYSLTIYLLTSMGGGFNPVEELVEEKKKIELIKVVHPRWVPSQSTTVNISNRSFTKPSSPQRKTSPKKSLKRRGALAVLGQLKKSHQKGGLNLGAVKVRQGLGGGGRKVLGGEQKSIYAKGLVSTPLGEGEKVRAGGGYETQGLGGGGQAGEGSLSFVGSTGASLIPTSTSTLQGKGKAEGLSRSQIAQVVRKNMGQIRFCYEQGLQMNSSLSGRVAVNWTIDSRGGVRGARIKNSSLESSSVQDCILRRLRTWKFPLPVNRKEIQVSYPFLLRKVGSL